MSTDATDPFELVKSVVSLVLALFVCCCQPHKIQPIESIHSFNEVDFNAIESRSLVIFDVDETLIQPTDTYLINEHSSKAEHFRKLLIQRHSEVKDWDTIASFMLEQAHRPLLEPAIVQKIQGLQKRNILVIACTAMNVGAYGRIRNLETWRYEQLKSLGFEGDYVDTELRLNGFKRNPGFYKGVLSTDLEPKGPVIGAFLDQNEMRPAKIVLFDDDLDFLKSVQTECRKRGIAFQGYQYKGAKTKSWNEPLIDFQIEFLIKNKRWLSDEQADAILRSEGSTAATYP